ncbi:MAG: ABC transporter permease subunit [Planctomycetes bacterium]|nr:ABC transporter permease subunit [Planctomycetota bacterium]
MRGLATLAVLFRRELKGYGYTPVGYVVAGIFFLLNGFFFGVTLQSRVLVTEDLFWRVSVLLLFVVPAVSMRLVSEEIRSGTLESLLTDPVRPGEIVLGKFLAGCAFLGLLLVPCAAFCLFTHQIGYRHGGLDPGPVISGLVGLGLLVGAALAIGTFFSSLTRNQVVAAVLTFMVLVLLYLLHLAGPALGARSELLREATRYFSLSSHLYRFFRGQIAWMDVVYFVKLALLALFLATAALDARRWR